MAISDSVDAPREQWKPSNQAACLSGRKLAQKRSFVAGCWEKNAMRNAVHPEDLMKPDLFSGIVLGSSVPVFVGMLLAVAAALTRV